MGFDCWCCFVQRMVVLTGKIVGRRQTDVLWVDDCEVKDCPKRNKPDCWIGHERAREISPFREYFWLQSVDFSAI